MKFDELLCEESKAVFSKIILENFVAEVTIIIDWSPEKKPNKRKRS